jgi:serine/threonine-protein kinase HipA
MDPLADSYEDLFTVCRKLRLPAQEINEQYRRMVFNVLAGNVDDHTKNFSFMMNEDGTWHITPAYDLTFTIDVNAPAYVNRHSMTIGGKNDAITKTDLLRFARMNDIKDAESIIADVAQAIGKFPEYARNCGIEEKWSEQVSRLILCDSEH